ncbi:PASTA domain-containing protein [Spirochaeta cellobiosiphila]|uniref:PASTA domain-containing protein n=1 Tax=Spirochaeta cellobiosiphila TaxID=504483 RepID=UPI0004285DF3|nr:PASTA domain-containing protein [Spirochaeta cellobiosiphila]
MSKNWFQRLRDKILPTQEDAVESRFFKISMLSLLGIFLLMVIAASSVFFYSLRGQEETMVPDVTGEQLVTSLIELQERELYPLVQIKYSDNVEAGGIISQDPEGGLLVKAGRRINLVVSKGAIVSEIENYIGQNLSDVRIHLQNLSTAPGERQFLRLKEPVIYEYSDIEAGTIIAQSPKAGTTVSHLTDIELVVSRGPKGSTIMVDNYMKLNWEAALKRLSHSALPFEFKSRAMEKGETAGTIVSQNPVAGNEVAPSTVMEFLMVAPKAQTGYSFGIFDTTLPEFAYPVNLVFKAVDENGQETELLNMKHMGGAFSVPYYQKDGTLLTLTINGNEVKQYTVAPKG